MAHPEREIGIETEVHQDVTQEETTMQDRHEEIGIYSMIAEAEGVDGEGTEVTAMVVSQPSKVEEIARRAQALHQRRRSQHQI